MDLPSDLPWEGCVALSKCFNLSELCFLNKMECYQSLSFRVRISNSIYKALNTQ